MAYPDKRALLNWANNYPKLWNAGDKQAWVIFFRTISRTTRKGTDKNDG
jgi:hypothetical protein